MGVSIAFPRPVHFARRLGADAKLPADRYDSWDHHGSFLSVNMRILTRSTYAAASSIFGVLSFISRPKWKWPNLPEEGAEYARAGSTYAYISRVFAYTVDLP